MDKRLKISEHVRLDENGRVALDDAALDAMMATSEIATAGGGGSVNSNCTNSSSCENTMNTQNCTNGPCAGSLNASGQCRDAGSDL